MRTVKILSIIGEGDGPGDRTYRVYDYTRKTELNYFASRMYAVDYLAEQRSPRYSGLDEDGEDPSLRRSHESLTAVDTPRWYDRPETRSGEAAASAAEGGQPAHTAHPGDSASGAVPSAAGAGSGGSSARDRAEPPRPFEYEKAVPSFWDPDRRLEAPIPEQPPSVGRVAPPPFTIARDDEEYLEYVIRAINDAKETVYGTAYTLDDADLTNALVQAKRRGLDVLLCADNSQFENPSSNRQGGCMVMLLEAGIRIRTSSGKTTHMKTWLIDKRLAFAGSGNATNNSRRHCSEFGIETTDRAVVERLKDKISKLWRQGTEVDINRARRVRGPSERRQNR